jgi:purine-binding chemotaxis protein CheW
MEDKNLNQINNDDDFYDDEDTQKDKYLTFHLAGEDYGIEIAFVTEIIGIQKITDVPDMPGFVKGVINLRGKVIPVMDVRSRFNFKFRDYDNRTCIVVVDINGTAVGLVVDKVNEVADIPEDKIEPPPKISKATSSRFIKGMGKMGEDVKILLKVDQLLFDDELEQIADNTIDNADQ